jgi:hypothetical protein
MIYIDFYTFVYRSLLRTCLIEKYIFIIIILLIMVEEQVLVQYIKNKNVIAQKVIKVTKVNNKIIKISASIKPIFQIL